MLSTLLNAQCHRYFGLLANNLPMCAAVAAMEPLPVDVNHLWKHPYTNNNKASYEINSRRCSNRASRFRMGTFSFASWKQEWAIDAHASES
ncbi:hypothetical protein NTGM5_180054 [Candidatus Nitrotoga sp. M5]|nr:hypothetical protein NTGM5_180054 [Candidatus Nitrotoga sp. M5]